MADNKMISSQPFPVESLLRKDKERRNRPPSKRFFVPRMRDLYRRNRTERRPYRLAEKWYVPAPTAYTADKEYREWKMFGGAPENIHYSRLRQINRETAHILAVAWVDDTGGAFPGSEMQCNPVSAGGVLYATASRLRVIALDAATGGLRGASIRTKDGSRSARYEIAG